MYGVIRDARRPSSRYYRTQVVGKAFAPASEKAQERRPFNAPRYTSPLDPSAMKTAGGTMPVPDFSTEKTIEQPVPRVKSTYPGQKLLVLHEKDLGRLRGYGRVAAICGSRKTAAKMEAVLGDDLVGLKIDAGIAPAVKTQPESMRTYIARFYDMRLHAAFDVAVVVVTSMASYNTLDEALRFGTTIAAGYITHTPDGVRLNP